MGQDEQRRRNYGVFTARYGNLYTARQLLQLFDRACGTFAPVDSQWEQDGGFVDPYRPFIELIPFPSVAALREVREEHFAAVRRMFETLDVFIFTLGLTEAWRNRIDGAVYPVCPGGHVGRFDPDQHQFVNFTVTEVGADLIDARGLFREHKGLCYQEIFDALHYNVLGSRLIAERFCRSRLGHAGGGAG
ncbi:MAG: GSCFA domain-containing protein [Holophaga sp.]|jgi:hypothetical protein